MNSKVIATFNPQRLGSFISIGFLFASILGSVDYTRGVFSLVHRQLVDALLLSFYLLGISLLFSQGARLGRLLIAVAFSGYGALLFQNFMHVPSQVFLLLVGLILALFFLFRLDRDYFGQGCSLRQFYLQLLVTLALGLLLNWFYIFQWALKVTSTSLVSLIVSFFMILGFGVRYLRLLGLQDKKRIYGICGIACLLAALDMYHSEGPPLSRLARASVYFAGSTLIASLPLREWRQRLNSFIEAIFFHPEGAVLVTFLGLCGLGTCLLNLPSSAAKVEGISWVDAAFTAVSAVCVTGLTVLDITHDVSLLGQVFILGLVQVGGLGIMALSSLALLFVGNRFSLRQETALQSVFGQKLKGEIGKLVKKIVGLTLTIELVGILLLTAAFRGYDMSWGEALWNGSFAAISAFCNAGFFLHSQNLIPYNRDPLVLNTIGLLIILGGLSPAYIFALMNLKKSPTVSLQFRFVTYATLGLLVFGTLMLLILEWNQSLATLSFWHKLDNAWFQSVVARTAGFNSVDIMEMTAASQLILMALMFIGGSPGGTAGGIKTTAFMVLVFTFISIAKGRDHVQAFSRRIPQETVLRATTVTLAGVSLAFTIFLALLLTQNIEPFSLLFEVISALGTVGLTAGTSPRLNDIGKLLIMAAMFLGRVGPLSVFLFLGYHASKKPWAVPEEDVVVT